MTFRDALQANQPAEIEDSAQDTASSAAMSPFSMSYRTDRYALDTDTTDQMLTLVLAFTNLL